MVNKKSQQMRYLGIDLPSGDLKDQRIHFKTKSNIDLTFPDIKQHVFIESTRNNQLNTYSTSNILASSQMSASKPPLGTSSNQQKILENQGIQQFRTNHKMAKKSNIQQHLSSVFTGPEFDLTNVMRKFDSEHLQQVQISQLQQKLQSKLIH